MLLSLGLIALGLVLLVAGGDVLLRGAVALAVLFRLTPAVIGLTVVAAGTSVPELAVSAIAAAQHKADLSVANVVGSNIFNIAGILGMCALIRPLAITGNQVKYEYPVVAVVMILSSLLMWDGTFSRVDAVLSIGIYVAFTAYMVRLVRRQVTRNEQLELGSEVLELTSQAESMPGWLSFVLVVAGIALLGGGAHATVTGAVELARLLGWSERVIGLTIVSIGTGLPEVFASIMSAIRGRSDVAIGNILGSNLFNMLCILGVSGLVAPLPVKESIVTSDCWWLIGVTLLLLPMMATTRRIGRWEGAGLLAVYAIYLGLLLAQPAGRA